jgi:hypothetical protein
MVTLYVNETEICKVRVSRGPDGYKLGRRARELLKESLRGDDSLTGVVEGLETSMRDCGYPQGFFATRNNTYELI